MEQIDKQTPEIIDEYITLAKHQWGTNRKSDVEASDATNWKQKT